MRTPASRPDDQGDYNIPLCLAAGDKKLFTMLGPEHSDYQYGHHEIHTITLTMTCNDIERHNIVNIFYPFLSQLLIQVTRLPIPHLTSYPASRPF